MTQNRAELNRNLAQMLKGGVIMDVTTPEQAKVAHAGNAAGGTDVGGDALERHDGAGAGLLGNACLLRCRYVHNDAAFEHLRELAVELGALRSGRWRDGLLIPLILCHVWSSLRWRVCVAT